MNGELSELLEFYEKKYTAEVVEDIIHAIEERKTRPKALEELIKLLELCKNKSETTVKEAMKLTEKVKESLKFRRLVNLLESYKNRSEKLIKNRLEYR